MDHQDPPPVAADSQPPETLTLSPSTDPLSPATLFTSPSDLCYDLSALHDLAARGQWRSVADKVARARSLSHLTKPHEHLVYLAFNALALFKLRNLSSAALEIESLISAASDDPFDSPKYRYETYPETYPNRSGSMLPFAVRYLHAELPQRLNNRAESLDRLYSLLEFVRVRIRSGSDSGCWKRREVFLLSSICCNHFAHKEFGVCLLLIREILASDPTDPILISKLGYVQLQIGDLDGAKASFSRVEGLRNGESVEFENLVGRNRALGFVVSKDYVSAVREYEECIERDPGDIVAVNNKALCLMYLRDLSDSIKLLEGALERVPTAAVNETVIVNLCSMYELAYVNHGEIKKSLSNWITRVAPDDFDSSSCTRN